MNEYENYFTHYWCDDCGKYLLDGDKYIFGARNLCEDCFDIQEQENNNWL